MVLTGAVVGGEVTAAVRFPVAGRTTGAAVVAAGGTVTLVFGVSPGDNGFVHPAARSIPSVTRLKKNTVFSCMGYPFYRQ